MDKINKARAFSSPQLAPSSASQYESSSSGDYSLEGVATNVKLLLKIIHDHNEASSRYNDDRRPQRIAGMMTILDDVKSRIEKSQSGKRKMAELRRCNTELRPSRGITPAPEKKPQEPSADESDKLRKMLSASMAARKSLEVMCSSLGKEKEIMACELAKKVHELNEMEEHVNDLKAQNANLLAKLQSCAAAAEQKEKKASGSGEAQGNAALQERNKALSEQLLRSLDSYRSLKRKYRDATEKNMEIRSTMEEIEVGVAAGLERIRCFRQRLASSNDQQVDIEDDISVLEKLFERSNLMISTQKEKSGEFANSRADIDAGKPNEKKQG
ncbi:hypothetical protein K2173_000284 [Erythroxylum novogranatense]|uniref:Myosin heavy chain-like protein n=1 Tax=Erythroxylum novogranatense TaxID=1862640 RepID=A0AAV8SW57_9ROSI|nr:hypothetical protein K2173_000284 [Erythroxylum novogranatense]